MEPLEELSTRTLVDMHNALALRVGEKVVKSWKSKKRDLVVRIQDLQARAPQPEPEPERPKRRRSRRKNGEAPPPKGPTIREFALELLCQVEYYENKMLKHGPENRCRPDDKYAQSVGLSYDEIIRRIQERFPGAKTSLACLRWYAVKVRAGEKGYEGYRLAQRRPRAT